MRTINISDASRDWRKLIADVHREPVRLEIDGGEGVVVLSEQEYRRMQGASRERLQRALQRMHDEVAASGLSEEEIGAMVESEGG